jgi:hypothetical protein
MMLRGGSAPGPLPEQLQHLAPTSASLTVVLAEIDKRLPRLSTIPAHASGRRAHSNLRQRQQARLAHRFTSTFVLSVAIARATSRRK